MNEEPNNSPGDDSIPEAPSAASPPARSDSRWDRVRPRGRLGQIAAIMVAAAAAVFIVGSIFVAGFALGSEAGGDHHGHGDESYSQGDEQHNGVGEGFNESGRGESGQDGSEEGGSDQQDRVEQQGDNGDQDQPGGHR